MKGSKFTRFFQTNGWERCRFEDTKLEQFSGGHLAAKGCTFAGCSLFGLNSATIRMSGCSFDGTTVQGNYWERPADLLFRKCTIRTRDDAPFLKLGVYTVGKILFDGCSVAGGRSLVDVGDLRPISIPPNTQNPDELPGGIALRGTTWEGAATTVVAHGAPGGALSPKRISIVDTDNAWPEGVAVATDLPPTWELK